MTPTSDLDRVAMIVLRYMRRPLFVLLFVYSVGIMGMALMPGKVVEGETTHMNLFHAFYFFTYTATTTGFGELPNGFSEEQRLWTIFCLYTGVIAWFYAIGSLIQLVQNPHFIQAMDGFRFARKVKSNAEPFVILCGFGDAGSLLARGLSDHRMRAVILDADPERIKALGVRDYTVPMPGLHADASAPKHLLAAGVEHPACRALVALTNDDDVNLKIAVMARHLNPRLRVICRSTSARHEANLRALDNVTVVDPFEIFAQLVSRAIARSELHNLNAWFVGTRGVELGAPVQVPRGNWILCGYGRMGRWIHRNLQAHGLDVCIIDPEVDANQVEEGTAIVRAHADHAALMTAGIDDAAGVIAATNRDADNLSTLLSVTELNPQAFRIVRQNSHENQVAFDAARADLVLQHSLTTARRILKLLISPLVQELIDWLAGREPAQTRALVARLKAAVGEEPPHLWSIRLVPSQAPAVVDYLEEGGSLALGPLCCDARAFPARLACEALAVHRDGESIMLPDADFPLRVDDEILLCGTPWSESMLQATLHNPYTLHYVVTGVDEPRGYLFAWLDARRRRRGAHS
ncbi:potassium channel family protein [Halomonas saccharevitans]|uniref:Trk K+ transport system, NAD-binding component n=1 Tax=Halomonas saccharevitans TaxID=416872 RepID=A0A1I6XIY4_9GAMM|nr:potassium channel protein [Halomonas saccharevitans]SFT37854.1 Trk K+ transport system, NAD-binding component [Halomonas saccharevitans]